MNKIVADCDYCGSRVAAGEGYLVVRARSRLMSFSMGSDVLTGAISVHAGRDDVLAALATTKPRPRTASQSTRPWLL